MNVRVRRTEGVRQQRYKEGEDQKNRRCEYIIKMHAVSVSRKPHSTSIVSACGRHSVTARSVKLWMTVWQQRTAATLQLLAPLRRCWQAWLIRDLDLPLFRTPGSWRRDPAAPLILLDLMFSPSWASDPGLLSVFSQARGDFGVLSGQALQSPSAPASCRQLTADRRTREAGTGTASADITHSQQRGCWQEHGQKTAYVRSNLTGPAV